MAIAATPASFSETGETALPDHWWTVFEDPILNRLMDEALTDNLSLRVTWDRLRQAEATARRAGASLYPTLTANGNMRITDSGGGSDLSFGGGGGSVVSSGGGRQTDYTVSGAASYELDLWGKLRSTARAAALDASASAANVRTAAITLSATVAQTWYAIVERRARIDLLESQIEANEQILRLVDLRFRVGQATAPDLLRQQQLLESSRGTLIQARGELDVLRHSLALLLGRAPNDLPALDDITLPRVGDLPATGIPADLIRRRPDLQSAFLTVRAADERVSTAIAQRYPSLNFSFNLQTTGDASELFHNWFASFVSQLALPIIDGGSRRAEVSRTQAVLSEALNNYELSVLTAFGEVEDALTREHQQRRLLGSLASQLDTATEVTNQLRRRFTQGATDYLDVLTALVSQQSLERQVLQARLNLIDARVELARALAGGWQLERPEERVAVIEEGREKSN